MSGKTDRLVQKIALASGIPKRGVKRFWYSRSHRERGLFRKRIESFRKQERGIALTPREVFEMLWRGSRWSNAIEYVRKALSMPAKMSRYDVLAEIGKLA